jgi:hypothetical protein
MTIFETLPLLAGWIRRIALTNKGHLYFPTSPCILSKQLPVEFMAKTGKSGQSGTSGIYFAVQCR